ncbi:MAG: hypothetical protein WC069_06615 [Candidatus Shapirobacteria bacterium]
MFKTFLIKNVFGLEDELIVMIGSKTQKGSIFAPIRSIELWERESLTKKINSLISFKWTPTENLIKTAAKLIFMNDLFGTSEDYGDKLFELVAWHNSRDWNLNDLAKHDVTKADAIESMTILTRLRYEQTSDKLHLNLFERAPFMCTLVHPMVVKIPIISFQYFLNIHTHYAFNSIRKANHPQADNLIDYLYEVLYLQQKTAIALHEFLLRIDYANKHKNDALFINAEINAIMNADLIFSYLKASIEKIIVIVGLTFGISNLDSKKEHKKKLAALKNGLPKNLFELFYFQFMFELFSSDNLDELNNYRSGLLHKKGIADLQPHNYVYKKVDSIPLFKIFNVVHEQHAKNTASLIGALALLTDKLVELDFPDIKYEEIPK